MGKWAWENIAILFLKDEKALENQTKKQQESSLRGEEKTSMLSQKFQFLQKLYLVFGQVNLL